MKSIASTTPSRKSPTVDGEDQEQQSDPGDHPEDQHASESSGSAEMAARRLYRARSTFGNSFAVVRATSSETIRTAALVPPQAVDDELRHRVAVVAHRPLREVEDREHQLHRVRRRTRRSGAPRRRRRGTSARSRRPVDRVGVEARRRRAAAAPPPSPRPRPGRGTGAGRRRPRRSRAGPRRRTPPSRRSPRTASGSSSSPTSQNADHRPRRHHGARPQLDEPAATASSRGTAPAPRGPRARRGTAAARGCRPPGPDQFPDWMPDTRVGGRWSSAHQSPCDGGMRRCRHESRSSYDAARQRARAPRRQVVRQPARQDRGRARRSRPRTTHPSGWSVTNPVSDSPEQKAAPP